jgi:hypothetical protein
MGSVQPSLLHVQHNYVPPIRFALLHGHSTPCFSAGENSVDVQDSSMYETCPVLQDLWLCREARLLGGELLSCPASRGRAPRALLRQRALVARLRAAQARRHSRYTLAHPCGSARGNK